MAKDAFRAAIVQSGIIMDFRDTADKARIGTLEEAEQTGADFFERAGFISLEEARACPAQKLHELQKKVSPSGRGYRFSPPIDNIFAKETTIEAMVRDQYLFAADGMPDRRRCKKTMRYRCLYGVGGVYDSWCLRQKQSGT